MGTIVNIAAHRLQDPSELDLHGFKVHDVRGEGGNVTHKKLRQNILQKSGDTWRHI